MLQRSILPNHCSLQVKKKRNEFNKLQIFVALQKKYNMHDLFTLKFYHMSVSLPQWWHQQSWHVHPHWYGPEPNGKGWDTPLYKYCTHVYISPKDHVSMMGSGHSAVGATLFHILNPINPGNAILNYACAIREETNPLMVKPGHSVGQLTSLCCQMQHINHSSSCCCTRLLPTAFA